MSNGQTEDSAANRPDVDEEETISVISKRPMARRHSSTQAQIRRAQKILDDLRSQRNLNQEGRYRTVHEEFENAACTGTSAGESASDGTLLDLNWGPLW